MNKGAAQRALDIINNLGSAAEEFRGKWLTIHTFSSEFDKANQRHRLIAAIEASIGDKKAQEILDELAQEISYLRTHPVGNLKLPDAHPNFYQNARQDIAQATLARQVCTKSFGTFNLCCLSSSLQHRARAEAIRYRTKPKVVFHFQPNNEPSYTRANCCR